jgi:hypothetical protein
MADIARLAGNPQTNAETRDRVTQLARSLNHTTNVGAQNLRLPKTQTIALFGPAAAAGRSGHPARSASRRRPRGGAARRGRARPPHRDHRRRARRQCGRCASST